MTEKNDLQQCRPRMHNWGCNRNWKKKSSIGLCGLMYKIRCGLTLLLLLWCYSGGHCNTMTDCEVFQNHILGMEKAYFILFIYIFCWLNIPTEKWSSKSKSCKNEFQKKVQKWDLALCLSCMAVKCCMSCRDRHWLYSSCRSSCRWELVMYHLLRRSLPQPFPRCYWCWKCSSGFMWHKCEGSVQFEMWWEDIREGLVWAMAASACGVVNYAACGFIFMYVHITYQTAILKNFPQENTKQTIKSP